MSVQYVSEDLPDFAKKVFKKLQRFHDCANDFDTESVDITKDWLDVLVKLNLLVRVQRSPAMWEISEEGAALLELINPQVQEASIVIEEKAKEIYKSWSSQSGYVEWQNNGNSLKQMEARKLARDIVDK